MPKCGSACPTTLRRLLCDKMSGGAGPNTATAVNMTAKNLVFALRVTNRPTKLIGREPSAVAVVCIRMTSTPSLRRVREKEGQGRSYRTP